MRHRCLRVLGLALALTTATRAQEGPPRAVLSAESFDFGRVAAGEAVQRVFSLGNDGAQSLAVSVATSDPAIVARVPESVAPYSSVEVEVAVDTRTLDGALEGAVVLRTNDPEHPELRLEVRGFVGPLVDVLPRRILAIRAFTWEADEKERSLRLVNRSPGELEILGVEGFDEARLAPRVETVVAGQEYELAVRLRPDGPIGRAESHLTVDTNKGEVEVIVLSSLKKRVYVLPEGVDFQTLVPSRTLGDAKLEALIPQTFHVYQYSGRDFRIEVTDVPSYLEVTLEPAEGPGVIQNLPGQGPTAIFDVTVAPIWSQLQPGPFTAALRVRTNDEEVPELLVPVKGTVE